MIEMIRRLSPRAEFLIVNGICFAYPLLAAAGIVVLRGRLIEMTNLRVTRGIVFEISCAGLALAILFARGWTRGDFPVRVSVRATAGGVLLWLAYVAIAWLIFGLTILLRIDLSRLERFRYTYSASATIVLLFFVINSVFEELFASGYAVAALESHGASFAISASAFIRSIYHVYQGPLAFLSIFVLGVVFASVYWRWRNLYPLMLGHTVINVLAFWFAQRAA